MIAKKAFAGSDGGAFMPLATEPVSCLGLAGRTLPAAVWHERIGRPEAEIGFPMNRHQIFSGWPSIKRMNVRHPFLHRRSRFPIKGRMFDIFVQRSIKSSACPILEVNVPHWVRFYRRIAQHLCRIVPFHKKIVRHPIGRSVIFHNRSIISTSPFIMEKNLTVIKDKIAIIHEKTSITAGKMSIFPSGFRHSLRSGRSRSRKGGILPFPI